MSPQEGISTKTLTLTVKLEAACDSQRLARHSAGRHQHPVTAGSLCHHFSLMFCPSACRSVEMERSSKILNAPVNRLLKCMGWCLVLTGRHTKWNIEMYGLMLSANRKAHKMAHAFWMILNVQNSFNEYVPDSFTAIDGLTDWMVLNDWMVPTV